jgi:hypothetical protein
MFSRTANAMALRRMLCDVSGCQKSKMVAIKAVLHVSQLIVSIIALLPYKITTRSERLIPIFSRSQLNIIIIITFRPGRAAMLYGRLLVLHLSCTQTTELIYTKFDTINYIGKMTITA